ncbi:MAG TPA: class II aldolase/adducin family protein [Candidatus Cloacimonadota bacterium]|nr:class II aldolase/adducin family protein [Candidatus Cloacimonadota bacterium]
MEVIFKQLRDVFDEELAQISEISGRIWQRGWAEANAGNISLRITETLKMHRLIDSYEDCEFYLASRSGSRYRQMEKDPLAQMQLIRTWGKTEEQYPAQSQVTSEWQTHLMLQDKFRRIRSGSRFILHSHPLEVIALSQLLTGRSFSSELTRVLPELRLYLPEGIAFCTAAAPGSEKLAELSCAALDQEKALVWQGHGLLCFGANPDEAFDYMEIVCKAAALYLLMNRS